MFTKEHIEKKVIGAVEAVMKTGELTSYELDTLNKINNAIQDAANKNEYECNVHKPQVPNLRRIMKDAMELIGKYRGYVITEEKYHWVIKWGEK